MTAIHHRLIDYVIPHSRNNHRAKILHVHALCLYLVAFACLNIGLKTLSRHFPDILGYATSIHVEELVQLTNSKRQEMGLSPLRLNPVLSQAAAEKAQDMFRKNYWAHIAPDGKTPWDFIVSKGYKYTVAGENLAKNFQASSGVVDAWMASPSHKDNLLKSTYEEVGFAVVNGILQGEETTLVVQMFGTPLQPIADTALPSAQPETVPIIISPKVVPADIPALDPVVIPQVAAVSETNSAPGLFASVLRLPVIDVVTLRRDLTMVFSGLIIGVLLLDFWIAVRKHKIRAVGSTVAHVVFFLAILFGMNAVVYGVIL